MESTGFSLFGTTTQVESRVGTRIRRSIGRLGSIQDPEAHELLVNELEWISPEQYDQLVELADLVVEWNARINLVSRKDCTPRTVWERHVLPSVAGVSRLLETSGDNDNPKRKLLDVGTGGGFPGLPLAICLPELQCTLLDSVGKKLTAVQDMAERLQLQNVKIHHGRAEDLSGAAFDIVTGRSVTALNQFCALTHHLLKSPPATEGGNSAAELLYWIGGNIDANILNRATSDRLLGDLLPLGLLPTSDKRLLIFPQAAVVAIAQDSGIAVQRQNPPRQKKQSQRRPLRKSKGAWKNKNRPRDGENTASKQRGYENFQRFDSSSSSSSTFPSE